jgi:hypothetical protein
VTAHTRFQQASIAANIYTCFAVTLCDSHRPAWRSLADCKQACYSATCSAVFRRSSACTKCLLEPQLSCLRAHHVAVSLLVLLPQVALLLVCDCYIIWHHQPGTLCLSYRYMLPSPCGSFSSRLLCQGWRTTAASSCQSLPEPLCRSCAPCSLLLLCWSQNVNIQYSKNLCMSPFSDTRASQSIPVCLGDFLHSADIISPAVCSGVLPVVSNSATFRLPKVFSES